MIKRVVSFFLCACFAADATLCGMTADELVQKTGIAGGLCSFPRVAPGDEKLALELAKRPAFVVHVLAQDAPTAARIRDAAETDGLLGRSLYVEKGAPAPLPFADRLVDVLVATDLRDVDLTPQLKQDWLRVLAPRRGAALVGRAKEAGAGLSQDALKTWTKDLPLAKVTADDSGVWAILKTDLPAGSDPWTHRCHGPENAQVSGDTTLKPPFLTQWWGMPRQEGFWGTSVVAGNGRIITIRSSRASSGQVFLTARSLTSGLVLWQRLLRPAPEAAKAPHGGYIPGRSCMLLDGDCLYLIDRDGVSRLNAETGVDRGRIAGPKPGGQVKWIACAGGLLAMLAGDPDIIQPITYQTVSGNPWGRDLAVYEAESGRELWHDSVSGDIDERLIAVRDDRLYALAQGVGVICRELRTGKAAWTNSDAELQADFKVPESKKLGELLFSQPALMALDETLVLRARWAKSIASLSRADGKTLWKRPSTGGGRALTALSVNGLWLGGGPTTDLKTGKPAEGPRHVGSGCGPTTAVPGYLITCFGAVSDMKSGKMIREADIKSPCDVGSLVAEGILVTVPSECGCNFQIKGYRALASAGTIQPHKAPDWNERLTVLDTAEPKPLALTESDWPTYRRDPQRSAASAATVGDAPKTLWRWTPAGAAAYSNMYSAASGPRLTPDFLATAPVAAAGRVWFASHDGTVRCLDAASGKENWKFPTGGMLFAPPTVWEGRLLVGGGDGCIYCLDATDGRCLWRLLAGPVDRRVFWFGHLVSTWPVVPGVIVQDGVAYAVAGYQQENGIHAYAFDPKTGKVLWEKDDAGAGGPDGPRAGFANAGHGALGGGRLWLCTSTGLPGSFDLQSGAWKPAPGGGAQFGCEIAVLDGKWVIQGGRRLSETQETLGRPLGGTGLGAFSVEEKPLRLSIADVGTALPAWDADLTLLPPKGMSGKLTAIPTAKLVAALGDKAAAIKSGVKPPPGPPKGKTEWDEVQSWLTEDVTPVAFALAKDHVVVAHAAPGGKGYKLSAFRRTDGSKAWTVDLPEQPAMNRMALDRDGRVILALCDGSVLCLGR